MKTGLSLERLSMVVPWRGVSSSSKTDSPFFPLTGMGTTWLLKYPSFWARSARFSDMQAYSSCSVREILYSSAIFSAVWPMVSPQMGSKSTSWSLSSP